MLLLWQWLSGSECFEVGKVGVSEGEGADKERKRGGEDEWETAQNMRKKKRVRERGRCTNTQMNLCVHECVPFAIQ